MKVETLYTLYYQPLVGKMSQHFIPCKRSSGKIKDQTCERAEIKPVTRCKTTRLSFEWSHHRILYQNSALHYY